MRLPKQWSKHLKSSVTVSYARGWTIDKTASVFLIDEQTLFEWMRRLDEPGDFPAGARARLAPAPFNTSRQGECSYAAERHSTILSATRGTKAVSS
jgi:hypothetical protein